MANKLMQRLEQHSPFQSQKGSNNTVKNDSTIRELVEGINKRLTSVEATLKELVKKAK